MQVIRFVRRVRYRNETNIFAAIVFAYQYHQLDMCETMEETASGTLVRLQFMRVRRVNIGGSCVAITIKVD